MADTIVLNIRERGARRTAKEVEKVDRAVGGLGRRAGTGARQLRLFGRASISAGHGMHLAAGAALYGGAAIGGVLLLGLKKSTDAWEEKRKIVAQTGAVLRSTGGAANITARQVDALSTSLSRKSGMDDEAIRSAENLLLTFRDIRNEAGRGNDVFNQTTKATVDLAAGMHMGLRQAALQVGKALNDPERGFKRLQRIGVAFTSTQEQQIKGFAAVGDRASAQKVILRELNKEFGGSAAAQATALDRLKVSWGNIEEAVGKGVSPVIDGVAGKLDHMLVRAEPDLNRLGDRLDRLFKRKDLSFADKLTIGSRDAQRTLRPYEREIKRSIDQMQLGDKLGQAFERAAPAIGDAAARAAPHAATAFIRAWWHLGPWGKLFSLALISKKLGLFTLLGEAAAGRFRTGWSRGGGNTPTPIPGGGKGGGGLLGRALGFARVAGPAAAFVTGSGLAGGPFGSSAGLTPAQERAAARRHRGRGLTRDQTVAYFRRHPDELNPEIISALTPAQRSALHVTGRAHGARARAHQPTGRAIRVHVTSSPVIIDGRKAGKAIHRVAVDDRARG
jgi:hypothetical protein